ncbi:MAG TPA: GAP family protein [Solirubrobacteraceae bacterium]|nr:GAP family protein [Solirubrobacteraceae bacterium]
MGEVFVLSLTAALNPTLLAVSTMMMLLPSPKRLMLGYWVGAMVTSITLGLVIVSSLEDSSVLGTTKHTLSPAADLALGGLALVLAWVLASGKDEPLQERRAARAARKKDKKPPRWQRELQKGTAKTTFFLGAVLTLPGASYLAGLSRISKENYSTPVTVLVVIAFNLVMLLLLEVPILAFTIAPTRTPAAIEDAKDWARAHGRVYGARGLAVIGVLLVAKALIELL